MPTSNRLTIQDSLLAECVLPRTKARCLGHQLYQYHESTDSTHAAARSLAAAGAPHGSLVVADAQTAGRGRLDRQWVSPPAVGLYVTLILRPRALAATQAPLLSLLAAVATTEAIAQQLPDLTPMIKWPNDILINGHKVAGILTEMTDTHGTSPCILVGIGVNVNTPVEMLPDRPLYPASSLRAQSGQTLSRAGLLAACLEQFESWLTRLENKECDALLKRWTALATLPAQPVTIKQQTRTVYGTIQGIDADGALLLRTAEQEQIRILSGDLL